MFNYGSDYLTVSQAIQISEGKLKASINQETKEKVEACHNILLDINSRDEAVYGVNTGFGPLCNTKISRNETSNLQRNLLLSHSVGMGDPIPEHISKLMLILKVHALCKGNSGISMEILNRIIWHIENDIIPVVPEQGSVGASGDLAPLSHLFIPLLGEGEVYYNHKKITAKDALEKAGKEALHLHPKAGLALINGTQFIAAHAVEIVDRLANCLSTADIAGAMMIEALQGSKMPFYNKLHETRPYKANRHVASRLWNMLEGSEIMESHADCEKVQDPYSLRCMPQVHGASRSAWLHLKETLEIEINSVTDNPIILHDGQSISGGNFHGQPIALPVDYAGLAASELGNISDRRSYLSLEGRTTGVPKLLMESTGLHSGFMIVQYTGAALASENKSLCFPASADSIPTSLGQEDHVSMGSIGARKTLRIVNNLEKIIAIELFCACQGLDFHRNLKSSPFIETVRAHVRETIPFATEDRIFSKDMNQATEILRSKKLLEFARDHQIKTQFDELFEEY